MQKDISGKGIVHRQPWYMRMLSCWQLYVLILPAVIYVFVLHYIPMYGVQIAFKDYRIKLGIWGSPWVGLKHFSRFVHFPIFLKILRNTLVLSLYSIATFPCSIILALMINEVDNRVFKRTVQMVTYMPHFISTVVVCSMVILFLNKDKGVINAMVAAFGGERHDFMTDASCFATIYVWSGVWQGIGWGTIIYLSALSSVSSEMVEAARIDGANRFQIVRHINLPSIIPTIVIMLIMRCGSVLSVGFEKVYLLQNSLNMEVSQIIATYVYEIGLQGGQFSYSSAIGLFNNVVNILLLLLVNGICKRVSDIGIW